MDWPIGVDVATGNGPIFQQIARHIVADILRGRLPRGTPLPGTRQLADTLGVHRNTAVAAYRELAAEGWVTTERARGTFVSAAPPGPVAVGPRRDSPAYALPDLSPLPVVPLGVMNLGGGVPDVRLFPAELFARAMRRAMRRAPLDVLSYGDPAGPPGLREAIARMLAATRGIAAGAENVLVVRGSQMGIDLVARTLLRRGDRVAIEGFGYGPAWEALTSGGAKLLPMPVDESGVHVASIARARRLRGVYVTPHHQFPTTVTLDAGRRLELLELARRERLFILEDDYDHEFHYEGSPVHPLASADAHGSVIYVGTFSKVLAPGLRLGFVVAPAPVVARLARARRFVDRQGDHLQAAAVTELIEDGELQRHIRRARRVYSERRARMDQLLRERFGGVLDYRLPSGGTAIWARVDPAIDVGAWAERALSEHRLVIQPARLFAFDGKPRPYLRVGFAQHDERETKEALKRLRAALPTRGARRRSPRKTPPSPAAETPS